MRSASSGRSRRKRAHSAAQAGVGEQQRVASREDQLADFPVRAHVGRGPREVGRPQGRAPTAGRRAPAEAVPAVRGAALGHQQQRAVRVTVQQARDRLRAVLAQRVIQLPLPARQLRRGGDELPPDGIVRVRGIDQGEQVARHGERRRMRRPLPEERALLGAQLQPEVPGPPDPPGELGPPGGQGHRLARSALLFPEPQVHEGQDDQGEEGEGQRDSAQQHQDRQGRGQLGQPPGAHVRQDRQDREHHHQALQALGVAGEGEDEDQQEDHRQGGQHVGVAHAYQPGDALARVLLEQGRQVGVVRGDHVGHPRLRGVAGAAGAVEDRFHLLETALLRPVGQPVLHGLVIGIAGEVLPHGAVDGLLQLGAAARPIEAAGDVLEGQAGLLVHRAVGQHDVQEPQQVAHARHGQHGRERQLGRQGDPRQPFGFSPEHRM